MPEIVKIILQATYLVSLLVLALGAFSWSKESLYWVAVVVAFLVPVVAIVRAKPNNVTSP